jgi:HEAT repeat protein
MAEGTLQKLIDLIADGEPAGLRRAAALVAGAVGSPRDKPLVKALLGALDVEDPELRIAALESLGRLRADEALPRVVELVRLGGTEAEAAARAAGRMGARGAKALSGVMAEAHPFLRRRVAAALAGGGNEAALVAASEALRDEDPGVVDAAARSLAGQVQNFGAPQRKALAEHLREMLHSKSKVTLSAASEAAMVRILGALHDPEAEDVYWPRLDPDRPAAIRAAALQALGTLPPPTTDARLKRLLVCAADPDFQVAAPALLLLRNVPVGRKNVKLFAELFDAPQVAARLFAVDKLRGDGAKEVVTGLVGQLRHPDKTLREQALAELRATPIGREALLDALLAAETVDEAWTLARAQSASARETSPEKRAQVLEQAFAYQDTNDRRAEPLWFLLREADAHGTRDRIEERALALRKKKKYADAVSYLRLLTRDPACGEDTRFELAVTLLKESNHDPAAAARQADPALGQFARLLQNPAFDAIGRVRKATFLDENDLFYLGFHFAEQTGPAREFGREVLELVVKKSPKSEVGKNARRKLKSEGLG